jgi:hypothetical protein
MNKTAEGKPLSKITYADLARMKRPEPAPSDEALRRVPPEDLPAPAGPVEIRPLSGASTVLASYHNVLAQSDSGDITDSSDIGASTSRPYERPNLEQLNARLPRHFVEQVRLFAFMHHMSVAKLILVALQEHIARASTLLGASTDSTASTLLIDDDDDVSRNTGIINLYEKLTGKKSTTADRQTLTELRQQYNLDHIRIGILLSALRAQKQINSLRYCAGAVAEAAALSPKEAESYLAYLRKKKGTL